MIYVLSDIHGNVQAFNNMMSLIEYNVQLDELYILGDIIDRNPGGIDIIMDIINRKYGPNVHVILGNHELMMAESNGWFTPTWTTDNNVYPRLWYLNGGDVTDEAFCELSEEDQSRVKNFITSLPLECNVTVNGVNFKLCHAAPEGYYKELQKIGGTSDPIQFVCTWDRDIARISRYVRNKEYRLIIGHTPVCNFSEVRPMSWQRIGNVYDIDCGAAYGKDIGGRLCCIRLDDFKTFYTDEFGNNTICLTKLPRPWRPEIPYENQHYTYEYDDGDLRAIMGRSEDENKTEPIPTMVQILKIGILEWFKDNPDGLVGKLDLEGNDIGETADDVMTYLDNAIIKIGFNVDALKGYRNLLLNLNME